MEYKQNLHIHSGFCDGRDTPEELVKAAIEKGFDSIGFSGHSYMSFAPYFSMSLEGTEEYKKEITRLKGAYKDKIKIFLGLEAEMHSFPELDTEGYDYLIGSCHFFEIEGEKVSCDRRAEVIKEVIDTYFGGDGLAYAKLYFKTLASLPEKGRFDIIGHFDIITKHSERENFFDREDKAYRFAAIEAAEALAGKIPYFEVNTGAMAKGLRTTPYPDPFIIKELKRLGFGAVISSDCHDKNMLDCGYDKSAEILKDCGYKEIYVLTEKGFVPKEI